MFSLILLSNFDRFFQVGNFKRFFTSIEAEASELQLSLMEPFLNEVCLWDPLFYDPCSSTCVDLYFHCLFHAFQYTVLVPAEVIHEVLKHFYCIAPLE